MEIIDTAARQRLIARFGPRVNEWCAMLPMPISCLAQKWGLWIEHPATPGATACVLFCRRHSGEPAVLKLTPERALGAAEAKALVAWRTSGRVPQILDFDEESGTLLLEAIEPGTALKYGQTVPRTREIVGLVNDLHRAPGKHTLAGFPPLIERVEYLFALFGHIRLREPRAASLVSSDLLGRSLAAARELAARPGHRVLLHGDLHSGNVLDGGEDRGLVAIDPRACAGDPAFDLIDWVLVEDGDLQQWMQRADLLASGVGGADPVSLWRWCVCTAVLEATLRITRVGSPTDATTRLLLALAKSS